MNTTKLKHLWINHRLFLIGFLAVSAFTFVILARTVLDTVYFKAHQDQPIEPWMPIGFIAKSYRVPPEILLDAANIPQDHSIRRQIRRIAAETGVPYEILVQQLMQAIQKERETGARP